MIPPRFTVTVDGTTLDGDVQIPAIDGMFYGKIPEEWIGKRIDLVDPVEITLTFKAWLDFEMTNFNDFPRMRLRWRHA